MSEALPHPQVTGLGMLVCIYVTALFFYLVRFLSLELCFLNHRLVISSFTNVNATQRDYKAKPDVSKALLNLSD